MQDKIMKFLAYDGKISVVCTSTTEVVEKARQIHDLSPVATAAFGRLLTISAIMGNEMKSEKDKLTVQMKGNGPLGTMLVTSDNFPRVKGYVSNPVVDLPLNDMGKLDVGGAVGNAGFINVIKDIGLKEPYVGICPLISGEIAEDFAEYFAKSEQKNTAVALGGLVDKNMTLSEIAKAVTGDENVQLIEENITPVYECDCSKEHMEEGLATLDKNVLKEMIEEDGKAELVCHFCNKKYEFSKEELEGILKNIC